MFNPTIFSWRRTSRGSQTPVSGTWRTNLDQLTLFPWRPASPVRAQRNTWFLLQGLQQPIRWASRGATPATSLSTGFSVTGDINAVYTLSDFPSFRVEGEIDLDVGALSGTVLLSGSFEVEGEINGQYQIPVPSSFAVGGVINADFTWQIGQQMACVAPDDGFYSVDTGERNYVF